MSSVIKQAIYNMRKLHLRYNTHSCVVEPHAFGLNNDGTPVLLGYQAEEEGNPNFIEQWKIFSVVDLVSVELLQDHFLMIRSGYIQKHPVFSAVLIQL